MRRTCGVDVVSQWRRAYVGEGLWDMHAAAALGIGPTGGKLEPSHAALRGRSAGRQAVGLNRLAGRMIGTNAYASADFVSERRPEKPRHFDIGLASPGNGKVPSRNFGRHASTYRFQSWIAFDEPKVEHLSSGADAPGKRDKPLDAPQFLQVTELQPIFFGPSSLFDYSRVSTNFYCSSLQAHAYAVDDITVTFVAVAR